MNAAPVSRGAGRRIDRDLLVVALLLAGLVLAIHGPALRLGRFMDDHAHYRQLRECDWSLSGLAAACRLELVGGVVQLWWLPECTLRFFRPVAFGLMKLAYTVVAWDAGAMHGVSLIWHWLVCVLLFCLLRRIILATGGPRSAWDTALAGGVAALFAMHPAHVATVQWIACQSELMVTTFLLAAALCFGRFRGWPGFADDARPAGGGIGWAVGSVVLYMLALGCRENAVMLPFVLAAIEPLVWRRRRRAVLPVYGAFVVVTVGYVLLRAQVLGGAAVPPRPYVMPVGDPDFPRYVFDKAWYYLLGQFLLIPCVPIAGLPYLREHAAVFYALAAGVGLLLVAVGVRCRGRVAGLLGPAWLVGFMAPLLPVFESPHHLYLPGVGWAIIVLVLLRGLLGSAAASRPWTRRVRVGATGFAVLLFVAVFARGATWLGLAFETGQQVENDLVEDLAGAARGIHDGDTLYVANLPLIGHYARLALEDHTGCRGLRVIPLMWSSRVLGMATPAELVWIDERTIEARIADDRYFAGPLAALVRESTGAGVADAVDCSVDLGFRVRVVDRDSDGIRALRFEFLRPLTIPGVHLFWGSRARRAYEVEWHGPT